MTCTCFHSPCIIGGFFLTYLCTYLPYVGLISFSTKATYNQSSLWSPMTSAQCYAYRGWRSMFVCINKWFCKVFLIYPFPFLNFISIGIIKTALLNMDRENREQYQVVIQAKDMGGQMGGLSGTTTVNITLTDVNDNPPRFPQSRNIWLNECLQCTFVKL